MSITYPRGSEWRKWDLHVHLPGTKLSDGYEHTGDVLDKFCEDIENSDVEVIGITDYFSVNGYFNFTEKFFEKYPDSTKVFFPNIELRLNESVNQVQEEVNFHVLFPPDITHAKAQEFLSKLKTELTDGNDRHKPCTELATGDYESATVTRKSVEEAVELTFGKKADRQDKLLIITAANNDGVRAQRGRNRKLNISDQIDKFSDGYFGGSQNTDFFLNKDRLEDDEQQIQQKPVYSCSDAHNFTDLSNWLGKSITIEGAQKEITWIKANPTFEGLQQTLIEPLERVKIQDLKPDEKEPYKYIKRVTFSGTNDFPEEIVLNSNLTSIIGSRSSGKSALLAYIAHSINPEDTILRQMAAQEERDRNKIGPAAGKTWQDVGGIVCKVEWGIGESEEGRIIYIPQNYLYSISKRPEEITKKIQPVLFANHSAVKTQYEKTNNDVASANDIIREATSQWFDYDQGIKDLQEEISNLGDKKSIEAAKNAYKAQIDTLKKSLSLSQADIDSYQSVVEQITQRQSRLTDIGSEKNSIAPFYNDSSTPSVGNIQPTINFHPSLHSLPIKLSDQINVVLDSASEKIATDVKAKILAYRQNLATEEQKLNQEIEGIKTTNKALIEKQQKNIQLSKLVDNFNKQSAVISEIETKEKLIGEYQDKKKELVQKINGAVLTRSQTHLSLSQVFSGIDQSQTEMDFGVEIGFNDETIEELSEKFNRRDSSPYLDDGVIDLAKIRSEVGSFLDYMNASQKLRVNQNKKQAAIAALCTAEEVRFNATLEGDKIGGFKLSSMTPGKQALFALTLILDESDDAWPLLIDQPEDDLDSRSIYEYIVPYLVHRKKERQILMVSHNANLVIGADSEQIIVANRHGADRKNRASKTFDYYTGAIEDSRDRVSNQYVLETCGIREHAIDILDGGKEAFEKRKDKYKI